MTNKREEEILAALNEYRTTYRALYGDEMADKTEVWYEHGWCYIKVASKMPDGTIVRGIGLPMNVRLIQLYGLTETLKRRLEVSNDRPLD